MKQYRLKKGATPFFQEHLATAIMPLDKWANTYHVDEAALEEVEPLHITFGHEYIDGSRSSLSGWNDDGSRFYFTFHFPSVKINEHDKFSKGRVVRKLMDKIQNQLNSFYSDFLNEEES